MQCKIPLHPNSTQIRQRMCLLVTNARVPSSKAQRAGGSSSPKCHHAEYFQVYLMEARTLQLPGAQWFAQGTSKPLTAHRQGCLALSQQKLPETLKLLNVMEEAAGKIL